MGSKLIELFRELRGRERPLRKVERRAAKYWVKSRLARIFPEVANDPEALEELYQALDLEARPGCGPGGSMAFEVILPEGFHP
jgi:hypothetical protein